MGRSLWFTQGFSHFGSKHLLSEAYAATMKLWIGLLCATSNNAKKHRQIKVSFIMCGISKKKAVLQKMKEESVTSLKCSLGE